MLNSSSTSANATNPADPFFQNSFYIGNTFMGILYGIELVLYLSSFQNIMVSRQRAKRPMDTFFLCFSTILLVLITISMWTMVVFGEEMWIINADFQGGQAAYLAQYSSVWYQTMGTAAFIIMNLMADALMIYRLYMLWPNKWLLVFPSFLWVACLVLGIFQLYLSGVPGGTIFSGIAADIDLGYYCSTVAINVFVTVLIVRRIIHFSNHGRATLGDDAVKTYTNVASIIIESALPYTLSGIAFLVSYGIGSQISILFLDIWGMWTCVSPQMIILRVTAGRGWTKEQVTQSLATVAFATGTISTATVGDSIAIFELSPSSNSKPGSSGEDVHVKSNRFASPLTA